MANPTDKQKRGSDGRFLPKANGKVAPNNGAPIPAGYQAASRNASPTVNRLPLKELTKRVSEATSKQAQTLTVTSAPTCSPLEAREALRDVNAGLKKGDLDARIRVEEKVVEWAGRNNLPTRGESVKVNWN